MSNNTGELSALGEAIRWITTHVPSDPTPVDIISDSLYAINVIQKKFKAKKNKRIITRIQALLDSIPSTIPISFHWTKAHTTVNSRTHTGTLLHPFLHLVMLSALLRQITVSPPCHVGSSNLSIEVFFFFGLRKV